MGSPAARRTFLQASQKSVTGCPLAFALAVEDQRAIEAADAEPALDDASTSPPRPSVRPVISPCACRAEGRGEEVLSPVVGDVLEERLDLGTLEKATTDIVHGERGDVREEALREERGSLVRRDLERSPQRRSTVDRSRRLPASSRSRW